MKTFACLVVAVFVAACSSPARKSESPPAAASAPPPVPLVEPNSNLIVQGVPPIPQRVADEVARYTDFRGHGFFDWHPTRREMLIAHRSEAGSSTQLFRLASPMAQPEQLTAFPDPVLSASYEPREGKYIVYGRDAEGSGAHQLYRMDLDTRRATLLTDPNERNRLESWLHRSNTLLVSSISLSRPTPGILSAPMVHTLNLIDPAQPSARRRLVTLNGTGWSVGGVSPDDRQVALSRYISAKESQVWLLNVATGKLTQILPAPRSKQRAVHLVGGFKRDNSGIYVLTDRDGEFREFMFYRFTTKRFTPITRHLPWDISGGARTEDGDLLALRANVDGREELWLFDADSFKRLPQPTLPPGSVTATDFHRTLNELAFTVNNAKGQSQIFTLKPGASKSEQWTKTSAPPGIDTADFSDQEIVRWRSFDGRIISGLLTLPPARFPGPRPVLVAIHGGPSAQAQMGFLGRYNYLLNELGIALIEPNIRGSSGYGKTFLALDNGHKREDAVRDIGGLLDWIATQPRLDPQRVVLSGGSYGGYVALAASAHYADRIAGTIDVAGIAGFVSFLRNAGAPYQDLVRSEYGDERNPAIRAFLQEVSPLTNAHRIRKPLLVVHGKNDSWVPYTEAEQIVATVRGSNTPVWYLLGTDENHGFVRRQNADYQFYTTVMFLQHVLLK